MIIGKMMLNKSQIAQLIPHSGTMILIDKVTSWNDTEIYCTSNSHQAIDNPLRTDNSLSAVHLIEYGAQAIAIHGGLLQAPKAGFLAAIRNAELHIERLDTLESELLIHVSATIQSDNGVIYQIVICDNQQQFLLTAQATIIHNLL